MPGSDSYGVPAVSKSGIYETQYAGGPPAQQPAPGAPRPGSGSRSPGSGFQVNTDGVRAQAEALAQCAERAAAVVDRLRSSLDAGGMPWGTDDMGKKFGHEYTGPANQGFASIAGIPQALAEVANELAAQADRYDKIEQHTAGQFRQLGQGGSGGSGGSEGPKSSPVAG